MQAVPSLLQALALCERERGVGFVVCDSAWPGRLFWAFLNPGWPQSGGGRALAGHSSSTELPHSVTSQARPCLWAQHPVRSFPEGSPAECLGGFGQRGQAMAGRGNWGACRGQVSADQAHGIALKEAKGPAAL